MKRAKTWGYLASATLLGASLWTACHKRVERLSGLTIRHEISPQPPRVGHAIVTLNVADASGKSVRGARISIEGDMSHAGMGPVFGEAKEAEPGQYQVPLDFSMGGDWIILVHLTLSNGQMLERQFEVNGVRSG